MPIKGSHKPERSKYLSREQVGALLRGPRDAKELRDYYLLACAYFLCRRVGEVVRLQPSHFANIAMDEIVVPILKRVKKPKDGQEARWPRGMQKDALTGLPLARVPVVDGKDILVAMLAWAGDSDWIFRGSRGGHLSSRRGQQIFRVWADAAGIPTQCTIHSLRHTACSNVVSKAGIAVGRDLAAHSSIAVTNTYVHSTREDLERAKGSLDP